MPRRRARLSATTHIFDSDDEIETVVGGSSSRTYERAGPTMRHDAFVAGPKPQRSTTFVPTASSPRKRQRTSGIGSLLVHEDPPLPPLPDFLDADGSYLGIDFEFDEGHPLESKPRKARDTDRPLWIWLGEEMETFVDELVRTSGRGDYTESGPSLCSVCQVEEGAYRCKECFTGGIFCAACIVHRHGDLPLHHIEAWDGVCFEQTTLSRLGLHIQLGHRHGQPCVASSSQAFTGASGERTFCVVHTNGIHELNVDFCACPGAPARHIQLLRAKLYPATTLRPASAATFQVLREYQLISFETKCSAYEYYNALARMTNNSGSYQPRDRYSQFLRMTREWAHIQMLKRFGRAHETKGCQNRPAGSCAVLCPACPQPGKNLPVHGSWRLVPPHLRFLYALFVAIDANFRMKRKTVSSEHADPDLNRGCAFYSEVGAYMQHVRGHWDMEQEKSRCVSHDAVNEPNRESRGTASSGIGTVDCARHNMKRPNGVVDLQKGERYINMDYALWKSLDGYDDLVQLVVSYDIVCQWSINIWRRLAKYQPCLQERARTGERFYMWLIPKFHLPAHIEACNVQYSFDLTPFVGRTDGEAPERGWANTNPLAASTREMGPGSRRDHIDNHFNDWNHKKVLGMGKLLLKRIQDAVPEMVNRRHELQDIEDSLPQETLATWTLQMEKWETDASAPNPFVVGEKHASLHAVRGRIAEETQAAVASEGSDEVRGDIHVAEMIAMGMQLGEQQRALARDAGSLGAHVTARQKMVILERGNKLWRKISSWFVTQATFMPEVGVIREAEAARVATESRMEPLPPAPAFAAKLWLPSELVVRSRHTVKRSCARYEFDMREARAHECLEEVCRLLLVQKHQYHAKDRHAFGVAANTRAKGLLDNIQQRIDCAADEYRAARSALEALAELVDESAWSRVLKLLDARDVRGMPRALFSDPERKKRLKKQATLTPQEKEADQLSKEMSWIWRASLRSAPEGASRPAGSADVPLSDQVVEQELLTAALCVEWAKARARAGRWREEVDLLEEEMRRVLAFQKWRAEWWRGRSSGCDAEELGTALDEAMHAYAEKQARIHDRRGEKFCHMWRSCASWIEWGRAGIIPVIEDRDEVENGDTASAAEGTDI
ncbi:unnamed protein product [Mycena citricolor]|uniref:CxC2-like cysteine cluster KDZ transposase-associated domain-containing protein n=1 Tax=Mycena citricolor TaxID=2018698 RepID=A0AAD2H608_9AGAR|nr:unnamed protein product [Mycena citricolor]